MKYVLDFVIAVLLTSLSYYLINLFFNNTLEIYEALIIGFAVCSLGAITEAVKAPMWLIIFVPFPVGMILLYVFLGVTIDIWFYSYSITLVIYTLLHIGMSYLFKFHSLIPAWKLA